MKRVPLVWDILPIMLVWEPDIVTEPVNSAGPIFLKVEEPETVKDPLIVVSPLISTLLPLTSKTFRLPVKESTLRAAPV